MSDDYFTKLGKKTQPIRDLFHKNSTAPAKPSAPKPSAPKPMSKAGELQGESLEDWSYMRSAQEKLNRKLSPKSVMGKNSSKR